MAKSGSFTGSTSPSQSKFLPVVYWSTDRDFSEGEWIVNVYVNYKCYDAYLGVIDSSHVTITVDGGGSKKPATKRISDSNTKMHEGRWIDTQTFRIPFGNRTSTSISLSITDMRNMNYSGVRLRSCSASGTAQLETSFTACSAPTSVTASPSNPRRGQTVTISWRGAKGGTKNSINGYDIEYKVGSGSWNSWRSISSTSTSSSTTNSWSQPVGQTGQYRVRTKGTAGSRYYSGWAYSNTITIANTAPTMSSVYCNTTLVPYNSGRGGSASFSWSGSDVDGDSLRYQYQVTDTTVSSPYEDSWSSFTTSTDKNIVINGYEGDNRVLWVRANDYKEFSDSFKSTNIVAINHVPTKPIISLSTSAGGSTAPNNRPPIVYYNLSSTDADDDRLTFEVYLEISDSASMEDNNTTRRYMGSYTNVVYLNLQDGNSISRYIGSNQYYRISVRAYDGYDYSETEKSAIRQKNSPPNYDSNLTNIFDDPGIRRIDSVYWELSDGRIRKGNVVDNEVILSWTIPDTTGNSNLKNIRIYKSINDSSTPSTWTLLPNMPITDMTKTTLTDSISGSTGSRIHYKLVFEDEYGWTQQDSNVEILTLFRNTNPVFVNSYIRLSKVSSTGAPTFKVYNNESVTVTWAKTSGDSDDDVYQITPTGGTAGSYLSSPNSFKISLVFDKDPFISMLEGYPQDSSGSNITEIVLATNARATKDNANYNSQSFTIEPDLFSDFNTISKRQQYSKVSIQIESEDTFGRKSTNKLSTPIILDFRQNPVLDSTLEYTINDQTNLVTIAKLGEDITSEPDAYTSDNYYMINSGEVLRFKFPKAISPNASDLGDDGIYSYLIYYATSTSSVTNQDFKLLKEIPKSQLTLSEDYYIYDHTVNNYSVNNYVKFAVSAKDSGYGQTELEQRENALEGNRVEFPYTLMICRATNPSITINGLDFDTASTEEFSRVKVNFTISDIGGSMSPSGNSTISSYWQYRNFERFTIGKFFTMELLLSETEDFTSYTTYPLDVQNEDSYPPEPGQKSDSEKAYAYPWSNYEVETSSEQLISTKTSYYAKLVLKIGHQKSSTETSNYLYAETPITFLRSLRAVLAIRDKKVGVNTKDPECTFEVSAGSSIEGDKNWVQFDSGIEGDQVIRFDLLTGHIVLGIIDCGRIL